MFLAPESNGFVKKRSCSVQGLVLQGVSLMCTTCILLLCSGCSMLQSSCLKRLFLPAVGSVWSLATVR